MRKTVEDLHYGSGHEDSLNMLDHHHERVRADTMLREPCSQPSRLRLYLPIKLLLLLTKSAGRCNLQES
jgi:hypothetical protein